MGTPEFALPAFEALSNDQAKRFEVCLVLSKPDVPTGRGLRTTPSEISQAATATGIELMQPIQLKGREYETVLERIAELRIDIGVVAAYGMLLTQELIDAPRLGTVNIHASLLPRWRGAAPIERAILAGDAETGVSIQQVRLRLDSGPIYSLSSTPIGVKSYNELLDELGQLGAALLCECLVDIVSGRLTPVEQNEGLTTYAEKLTRNELSLDPALSAVDNFRRVQAASKRNPARAVIAERSVRVLKARLVTDVVPLGQPLPIGRMAWQHLTDTLLLGTTDGLLGIEELAPDGKLPMSAGEFVRGLHLAADDSRLVWSTWT